MNLIDYIALGFRNIWRRKSRSFLTILAVVIGAISIIIMLSLVLGAKQVATQQLESMDALTLVSVSANPEMQSSGSLINTDSSGDLTGNKLNDTTIDALRKIPHVVDATPLVGVWVKSCSIEGQTKKYRLNMIAYDSNTKVLNVPVGAGRSLQSGDMDKIVIGGELLRNFGYASHPEDIIGKTVTLYAQNYVDWGPLPPKPPENADDKYWQEMQKQSFEINATIVGVVTSGFDESTNYITLDWGRRLMTGVNWKYDDSKKQELEVNRQLLEEQLRVEQAAQKKQFMTQLMDIDDDMARSILLREWEDNWNKNISERLNSKGLNTNPMILSKDNSLSRDGYGSILVRVDNTANIEQVGKEIKNLGLGAQTAKEMLAQIEKIFGMIGLIIGAIGGIVLFVASLGIINTMIMATYERTREIGIMRACGATRSDIRNLFIFEAGLLGFLGGIIGLVLSFGLAKVGNSIGNGIAASQGIPITDIISFQPWLIISVIALTTLIGILAGLFPAIRASRLDPVEALRYE